MTEARALVYDPAHGGGLLVLDNANDLDLARTVIPAAERAASCSPSNNRDVAVVVDHRYELKVLGPEVAAHTLLVLAGRLPLAGRSMRCHPPPTSPRPWPWPESLAACSWPSNRPPPSSRRARWLLAEYPRSCTSRRHRELLRDRGHHRDHDNVTVTYLLAFERVASDPGRGRPAPPLALLAPAAIPEEVLSAGAPDPRRDPRLRLCRRPECAARPSRPPRFALVRRDPDAKTLSMHRLAQTVLRYEMPASTSGRSGQNTCSGP